jgi:hypothetical protein
VSAPIPPANGSSPIDRVLAHLENVRPAGAGWVATCTAHEDRHPSLSVKETSDGTVLLRCRTGCSTADIVRNAGLCWPDLFPAAHRERFKTRAWGGGLPMGPSGRPALLCMGDDQAAAFLGELARLSKVRGTLDRPVAAALKAVAAAVGVSPERLTAAARAAFATEEPA